MFDNAATWAGGTSWYGGSSSGDGADRPGAAGASSERRRGKLVLRGQLDEVGLDDLLVSLRSRGKSCIVEIRAPSRRGEVVIEGGRVVSARADGLAQGADTSAAIAAMRSFSRAIFDVVVTSDSMPPPPPYSAGRSPSTPPPAALPDGDATEVALAAAVMNACGAYTRKWLGAKLATTVMTTAFSRVCAQHAALDAFRISPDGMVSVTGLERAKSAIPRAVAQWVFAVFQAGAMFNAARFQRAYVPEMLGGLMRLLDKGGWGEAFREGGIR
jgi:hypothetical protein